MEVVYIKVILLVNSWLFAMGSPVAMLHATSSQSIVFHDTQRAPSTPTTASTHRDPNEDHIPKYEYKYEVSDQETGDRKTHWESRDGDKVRGAYTLYEPDGALRTVEYTADALHGFNAVVKRSESPKHQFPRNSYKKNTGGHPSYDQTRQDDMSVRGAYPNDHANDLGITRKTYNEGVQFNVIH